MKRIDLTDDQHITLVGILRERVEARAHDRAELIAQGAERGLIDMADAAIMSLTELVVACSVALEVPPVGHAAIEDALNRRRRGTQGFPADESSEAMLQRALGVGPVDPAPAAPAVRCARCHDLWRFCGCPGGPRRVYTDESGATGTQRSDWGERGEGGEQS